MQGLRKHADDPDFQQKWQAVKLNAKSHAMAKIAQLSGVEVRADALLDIQVSFWLCCYLDLCSPSASSLLHLTTHI